MVRWESDPVIALPRLSASELCSTLCSTWGVALSVQCKTTSRLSAQSCRDGVLVLRASEPELFTAFATGKRTADQYETWLGDVLCRSLLE